MTNKNNDNSTPNSQNQHVIIIGAGLASWNVIDALRAKNQETTITLITTDSADRYHKPMLSMAISQNKTAADLVREKGQDACNTANVTLMANTAVYSIDPINKIVQTQNSVKHTPHINGGDVNSGDIYYDKLVIATGAHPAIPASLLGSHHLNHLTAFTKLQESLGSTAKTVAVVGAGMVGTETAEDLYKAGHTVHLIDTHTAPLSSMFPALVCNRIKEAIIDMGVIYHPNNLVTNMTKVDSGYQLTLEPKLKSDSNTNSNSDIYNQGSKLIVDEVIACTGLSIDHELFTKAGISTNKQTGIMVDPVTLQTNIDNIYAIGDCMSVEGVPCRYVAPLRAQAGIIADEILGNQHLGYTHKAPMIRLKNKCISVMATGTPSPNHISCEWRVVSDETITDTDSKKELKMEQVIADKVVASVTVKQV